MMGLTKVKVDLKNVLNMFMLVALLVGLASCDPSAYRHYTIVEWPNTTICIAAGLAGILFTFFGVKLMNSVLFLTGFQIGAFATALYFTAEVAQWLKISQDNMSMFEILFPTFIGILFGILVLFLRRVGLFFLAVLTGFYVGIYVLSCIAPHIRNIEVYKPLLLLLTPCIFAILIFMFENAVIILFTSMVGAIGICSGIDVFAYTGFNKALGHYWEKSGFIELSSDMNILLVSYVFLVVAGCCIQYRLLKEDGGALLPSYCGEKTRD